MQLKDHMREDWVFTGLKPADKSDLLKLLAEKAAACLPKVDGKKLLKELEKRETQVTTGIGLGVAIPHAFIDGVDRMTCLLAQVPEGVDFQSVDRAKVHFVFLIVSPPGKAGSQIKLLARIARVVTREFIQKLAGAADGREIHDLVIQEDDRHV
jgi:mannitol/fructose-specific phosphotransferase system IIA component (Ntr-type)